MEPELHVDDVARAAERLAGIANITPELTSRTLDERFDAHLRLKAECFQRTGSFKFRGAYNAIASLSPDERARGVVTIHFARVIADLLWLLQETHEAQ